MGIQLKKKTRKHVSGSDKRETIAGVIAIISVCFFLLTLILWGVSELIDENFIVSEMLGAYSVASLFLCFGIMFIALFVGIKGSWFGRIICLFIAGFTASGAYSFVETSDLLYKDKSAYENKQFETLVMIPTGTEFDDPDYGREYLMELEFNELTLDVYSLDITRSYYHENLSGRQLEIDYLPNSRYAVIVKAYQE
ncbi:hypothetical protein [Bacillus mesophilum]|uniref:Uncharacterized protein n=1 Tax=Bacillus mesophilum TaxID=1071718 RepID=A0A7V7RIR5_9BACI|nr:hypothetical protein [Bacillus mesophilum]KAB2330333.1 hypothetical protein F7732_19475 [Bacillus mesophilum]